MFKYITSDNISHHIKRSLHYVIQCLINIDKIERQRLKRIKLKQFLQQRCENYKHNQTQMIDSLLNRQRRRIVIDQVLINDGLSDRLLISSEDIKTATNLYFQTAAGTANTTRFIPPFWQPSYQPIDNIDPSIYNSLMVSCLLDE